MTVVYVDLLWLLNFVANHLLLLGAGRLAGAGLRRWRIALGAALGALYAVALFLPGMGWLSTLPCKLAVAVVMVLCAYGGEVRLWRVLGLFFAASAALAGAVLGFEWLGNTTLTLQSGVLYTQMDLRLLLVVFLACYFVFSLLLRRLGQWKRMRLWLLILLQSHLFHGAGDLPALLLRFAQYFLTAP